MNKCIDCKKELSKDSNSKARCRKCHFQYLHDNPQSCANFKHGRAIKKYFNCIDCGIKLSSNPFAKRCHICATKHLHKIGLINCKGEKNSNWNGGKPKCIDCGKRTKDYNKKRCWECYIKWTQIPKNNAMYGIHRFGKKAPGYIHGMAYLPYPLEWWKIRIEIRNKFNHKCIICNKKAKHVHHIDYNKKNCKEDNLILLCLKHHVRTNGNRDYWYAYFKYLMENR